MDIQFKNAAIAKVAAYTGLHIAEHNAAVTADEVEFFATALLTEALQSIRSVGNKAANDISSEAVDTIVNGVAAHFRSNVPAR
mgnify:FL=1